MQDAVAEKFRGSENPHKVFDEDDLFEQLGAFLCSRGVSAAAIAVQKDALLLSLKDPEPDLLPTPLADSPSDSDEEEEKIASISPLAVLDLATSGDLRGLFVVSLSGSVRRLHRVGDCWRVPGQDYLRFEVLGDTMPEASSYTCVCKFCFKKGSPADQGVGQKEKVGEDSSSSSSGTS